MSTLYLQTAQCDSAEPVKIIEDVKPANWGLDELNQRAGALVREALTKWPSQTKRTHWEDMRQTAVLTFLEFSDQGPAYAYGAVRIALKNYIWVHIRGLNGGWKSLACIEHDYRVLDVGHAQDEDGPNTLLDRLVVREYDNVPRPVEWAVQRKLAPPGMTQEETLREVLYILAGMCGNLYPEQLYRAALIITLLGRDYTWEHVKERTGLSNQEVFDIYWAWRKRHLNPYLTLTPMHQEIIKLRGQMRITYFEELDSHFLNTAVRKMVVFPHGVYTIIYKRRGRNAGKRASQLEGSLQKCRHINGRNCIRAVHLGKVGEITKERLYEASFTVERKLAAMAMEA